MADQLQVNLEAVFNEIAQDVRELLTFRPILVASEVGPFINTDDIVFLGSVDQTRDFFPGQYLITVTYLWAHDSTTRDFITQFLLNGVEQVGFQRQEPQDSAGTDAGGAGTDQSYPATIEYDVVLGAGDRIQFLHRSSLAGVEATVRKVIVKAQRVIT